MKNAALYTLLITLTIGIFFGMIQMVNLNMNNITDTISKVPKWKLVIGFWCWALYQLFYPFLIDGHPWKNGRVGLTGFVRHGKKLLFEFGAMFWYGFMSMLAVVYLLCSSKWL